MKRIAATLALGAAGLLAGCDGLREAMTAHVDVVARAGSQELSVSQLADLVGNAPPQTPVNRDFTKALADLWVGYTLLGRAAAQGDSLNDPALVESALWAEIANGRAQKFYQEISQRWAAPDSSAGNEAAYARGDLLAAQHILIPVPADATPAVRDSLRREAEAIRAQVTPANFAVVAAQTSGDPGSARRGGYLGVFPRGVMVPEFERAVVGLQPGQMSGLVQSQFGYHIIRRPTYSEVREDFMEQASGRTRQVAESTYIADLEAKANVEVKSNAPKVLKEVARDIEGNYGNETVVATARNVRLTAGRLARWLDSFPPQARVRERILAQPDSTLPDFVRQIMRNELILAQADSANIQLDSADQTALRQAFQEVVIRAWQGLNISPDTLRALSQDARERERIAGERVDAYLAKLVKNEAQFVDVPGPIRVALLEKYEPKYYPAGLDRAVEQATAVRAQADAARAAAQPPSQVPVPQGGQAPRGQAPQGQAQPTRP